MKRCRGKYELLRTGALQLHNIPKSLISNWENFTIDPSGRLYMGDLLHDLNPVLHKVDSVDVTLDKLGPNPVQWWSSLETSAHINYMDPGYYNAVTSFVIEYTMWNDRVYNKRERKMQLEAISDRMVYSIYQMLQRVPEEHRKVDLYFMCQLEQCIVVSGDRGVGLKVLICFPIGYEWRRILM